MEPDLAIWRLGLFHHLLQHPCDDFDLIVVAEAWTMRKGELVVNLIFLSPAIVGIGLLCLLSTPLNFIVPVAFCLLAIVFFVRARRPIVKPKGDALIPSLQPLSEKRRLLLISFTLMAAGILTATLSLLLYLRSTIPS